MRSNFSFPKQRWPTLAYTMLSSYIRGIILIHVIYWLIRLSFPKKKTFGKKSKTTNLISYSVPIMNVLNDEQISFFEPAMKKKAPNWRHTNWSCSWPTAAHPLLARCNSAATSRWLNYCIFRWKCYRSYLDRRAHYRIRRERESERQDFRRRSSTPGDFSIPIIIRYGSVIWSHYEVILVGFAVSVGGGDGGGVAVFIGRGEPYLVMWSPPVVIGIGRGLYFFKNFKIVQLKVHTTEAVNSWTFNRLS